MCELAALLKLLLTHYTLAPRSIFRPRLTGRTKVDSHILKPACCTQSPQFLSHLLFCHHPKYLCHVVIRPRRSRSAAACSRQTFPWISVGASVCASVCPVHCGKTADRIRMPFGIIGRTGPEMRQVVWFGIGPRKRVLLGANLGRAIVTNGDFTAYVCDSAATRPSSQITLGRLVAGTLDLQCE